MTERTSIAATDVSGVLLTCIAHGTGHASQRIGREQTAVADFGVAAQRGHLGGSDCAPARWQLLTTLWSISRGNCVCKSSRGRNLPRDPVPPLPLQCHRCSQTQSVCTQCPCTHCTRRNRTGLIMQLEARSTSQNERKMRKALGSSRLFQPERVALARLFVTAALDDLQPVTVGVLNRPAPREGKGKEREERA
eukprot:3331851-Rhodomonas_salina.1